MPWIESHTSLARHPKTLRLARILGIAVPAALGHMHLLWWWAIEYAPDGDVGRFDAAEVALACMWEGDETALLPALQRAGFVDANGHIHDWHDYAGKLVDRRRRNAERMREDRAAHVADAPSINSDACEARAAHVQGGPDARVKLQNSTYRTVPTEPNTTNTTGQDRTNRVAPDADAPDASQTNDPAIGSILDARSEEPPPEETPRPGPLAIPKPTEHPFRDLWTAFDQIFGEARTRTERGRRAKACEETRESRYTAAEIVLAAQHWPNVMGDATMTELGIVANLGKLLHGPQVNGRSNGTVTAHTQRLTETALVPHQATVADIRRRRKGNDEPGR
jgi:hypothetical protein